MTKKLLISAIIKYLSGIILLGALIFIPAGKIFYNGLIFMGVLFIPVLIAGVVMAIKNPSLLEKRLSSKEKQKEQNVLIKLSGLMFLTGFILAGLGVRFNWYILPESIVIIFSFVFLLSYLLYAEVLRENTYLSRIIEVQKGQKVIDTGLYRIVRHPMYFATVIMFLSIPLILGSVYAFLVFLAYPFIIAKRIKNEEALLEKELLGYAEYKKKVKYRLIPFLW